jgi:glycosyltransferase involved in cell wall biosynthesis
MRTENMIKEEGGQRGKGVVKGKVGGKPLVSIITAVYNGNAAIEKAIKSVVNQNYPNFEYLVIDGGSADGTVETLKKYNDVIDYWLSEPDNGVYDALNKGIDLAHGEWIYFLGADDKLFDNKVLQSFLAGPQSSKMVYGNVVWAGTGKLYDGEFSQWKLCRKNICQQAIFYHRDLFRMLGKFETKYPLQADWLFNLKAFAEKDTRPLFVNAPVAVYSDAGLSSVKVDMAYFKDHAKNIRKTLGLVKFGYFKCYLVWEAIVGLGKKNKTRDIEIPMDRQRSSDRR